MEASLQNEDRISMSFTLSDGRTLSYSKYGKVGGTPLLLNHGTPGSRISLDDELFYKLNIELIFPERPGYGNSSPNLNSDFKTWAHDVSQLLDHLNIHQAHIGGVSGGGAFTLGCAAYQPKRFKSVSLISSAAPPQTPNHKQGMNISNRIGYWMVRYTPFLAKLDCQNFANSIKTNPRKVWEDIQSKLSNSDREILQGPKGPQIYKVFVEHINEAFKQGIDGHYTDMKIISNAWNIPFSNIASPINIWHGSEDTLAPISGAIALSEWLPNSRIFVFPNKGHMLTEEEDLLEKILTSIIQE